MWLAAVVVASTNSASLPAYEARPPACERRAAYAGPAVRNLDWQGLNDSVSDAALPPDIAQSLDSAFSTVRKGIYAPAMSAALLLPGQGLWQTKTTPPDAPLLFWASAGKMATAVVVLQLVEEGRISLDDRVSRWIAGVPNGNLIAIGDLLGHTSGLFSANEDKKIARKPHFLDLPEQLEIVRRHGSLFCPGAGWRYSNTGYSLLGEIIEKVDGVPVEEAITRRIIEPLHLRTMRALRPGGSSDGVAPPTSAKGAPIQPSWPGAAGPIVSDAADMARFLGALLAGRLVKRETVASMLARMYPMFDAGTFYGLGLMLFDVPDGDRTLRWIGHAGGVPGASAIVAYSQADNAIVAVALTGDGSAAAVANFLLKTLTKTGVDTTLTAGKPPRR
jgi:D-alanyl-D-alanine carboxypeptidase